MKLDAERGLTLYIQKDRLARTGVQLATRLGRPDLLVMRLYWPKTEPPSILPPGEGTWKPPGIVTVK